MKRYFSGTTAQQAPSPWTARHTLVSLPGTVQTARKIPHWTKLIITLASSKINSSVTRLDEIDENRLARSQRSRRFAAASGRGWLNDRRGASSAEVMA
jgi:hypothetical protein